jgi:transmembrane sensor
MGEQASREAAAWAAKLNGRAVETQLLADFYRWHRDPENAAAYARVEAIWQQASTLGNDPEIALAVHGALEKQTRRERLRSWTTRHYQPVVAAATIVSVVGIFVLFPMPLPTSYETGIGEQRVVRLVDGSRVRINTDSLLRVRLNSRRRVVDLVRGEAFFEVAHDAARPFTVRVDSAEVRAVGTRFDVRRIAADVRVILAQGLIDVRTSGSNEALRMHPGQAIWMGPRRVGAVESVDADALTSWTVGQLSFQNTPLRDAVAEVNRYAPKGVDLATSDLGAIRVTGVFETGDTRAFVGAVTTLFDLHATTDGNGRTVLTGRDSSL